MTRLIKDKLLVLPVALLLVLMMATTLSAAKRPWLGVYMQNVTDELAEAFDLTEDYGVIVNEVVADSPAEKAGLKQGDVIIGWDRRDIDDTGELTGLVSDSEVGDKVTLRVVRDGKELEVPVVIGERDEPRRYSHRGRDYDLNTLFHNRYTGIGVSLQSLSGDLGEYFGVPSGEGALITKVYDDSPAEDAGLKTGDVIVKVDDEPVDDPSDVNYMLEEHKVGDKVDLTIMRDRSEQTFAVEVDEIESPQFHGLESLRNLPGLFNYDHSQSVPYHFWYSPPSSEDDEELQSEMKALQKEMEKLQKELKSLKERLD
jgi:serine protease Do